MATIPRPVRIGLSTNNGTQTSFPTSNVVTLADMAAGGERPAEVIQRSQSQVAAGATLRYPADVPQYYFQIAVNMYNRASWLEVGNLALIGTIVLPLPMQIVDNGSTEYEIVELGIPGAAAMTGIGAATTPGNQFGAGDVAAGAVGAAGAVAAGTGRIGSGVTGALGVSVNQYQTVMLKGPTYKTHSFTWHLSADTAEESRTISQIKAVLDDAKAPALSQTVGSVFWNWPHVVVCGFRNAEIGDMGGRLYRFKPSVITDVVWDFTAPGQPAFYKDTKAPQSLRLTLRLRELEYWLRSDAGMNGF